jgi:hypothetical protein
VSGSTNSEDFPLQNPLRAVVEGASEAWVAKLNPSGSTLVFSTFLGGNGDDNGSSIAVDGTGSAYVHGLTGSTDLPTTPGVFDPVFSVSVFPGVADSFVARLAPSGSSLVYLTYLGGNHVEFATGIAVTAAGEAWATGVTQSPDFPTQNPLQGPSSGLPNSPDAYVTKLSASGAGLFSTYLGGSGFDSGIGIAVDGAGNAYVTGVVDSTDFPVVGAIQASPGGFADAYLTKFTSSGSAILFSTYLGGSTDDEGIGVAVTPSGRAFVTGRATSANFPTKDALQPENAGGFGDAFVTSFGAGIDYFLRTSGNTLLLKTDPPTSSAVTFRDSAAVKFAGGNAWKDIGTWTAAPTPTGTLTSLGALNAWVGLKNSDDIGTRFDVRAQLMQNGLTVAEGTSRCVQGVTRNPALAKLIAVAFDAFAPVAFAPGDNVTLKVSTRIGTNSEGGLCGGHANATGLRLYFDSVQRPAGVEAGLEP